MRGQYTIEEQAEQLKEYLGCPCTYFPPMADDQPIMAAYRQARVHGEKEGFLPMLVAVDELLLECLEDADQVRAKLLAAPLESGEEFLQKWLKEIKEELGEDEPDYWEQLMGEVSGEKEELGRIVKELKSQQRQTQEELSELHRGSKAYPREVEQARHVRDSWLAELVADCSDEEAKLITDTVLALKTSLRRLNIMER